MRLQINRWTRKLHRWGAILTAVPLLLVILTGLLLQVKKQVPWVQPPTQTGVAERAIPEITWEQLLISVRSDPDAKVQSWSDIDRLDVQVRKGIIKVQTKEHWEVQIDSATGAVLSSKQRNSDWIEQLHDGSFWGDWAKLWLFLPNGLILLGLWVTGAYLWYLPFRSRQLQKAKQVRSRSGATP